MRAFGTPSASTVASVIAVGSRGSQAGASVSQAANRRNGSSAAMKSPVVNQLRCCIGAVSRIVAGAPAWVVPFTIIPRAAFIVDARRAPYHRGSLWGGPDKTEHTGSIAPPSGAKAVVELPPDGDLAYARAAATEVLRPGRKDAHAHREH